ncbi:hypothetical protein SteCoe_25068 [Stentor coeruleus]|uniref:Inositol polyphosphate-related phosphatase domain-containing protein n=1 Tax=Stentor coeruleus TaxID=5963 RepID=A0A1R2BG53_9CILI|nr:hypothetical protein SteCoe_25068 [Stentor coeruleus]
MKKIISSRLQKTESIDFCALVSARVNQQWRDCYITLVLSNENNSQSELSLFLFRPSRMYIINGKIELLTVMPVLHELTLTLSNNGFLFQWRDFTETQFEIMTKDISIYQKLLYSINQATTYQRESFKQGSPTHQWIWHYQDSIHPKLKDHQTNDPIFSKRKSIKFQPEHFGTDIMITYIKEQLRKRESDFINIEDISMFIGVWNCAGTGPEESLFPWFDTQNPPDLIVICLQEMCLLNARNILGDESRENQWRMYLYRQISEKYINVNYVIAFSQSLVGLFTLILVKSFLSENVYNIKSCNIKLGFKGFAGNKGAICTRFNYINSSICIVNCHLAAHKPKIDKRNKQVKDIFRDAAFSIGDRHFSIYEHEFVFFTGDLNYRIHILNDQEIRKAINSKNYQLLLHCDQLMSVQNNEKILSDFSEASITFPPTYKFKKTTSIYSDDREPSWCERILYRGPVNISNYNTCFDINQSDHKPILANVKLPIKTIRTHLKKRIKEEILLEITKIYEDSLKNPSPPS